MKSNGKIDTLIILETKTDENFPVCQFEVDGFNTLFPVDRDQEGGAIMLCLREHLPGKICRLIEEMRVVFNCVLKLPVSIIKLF